VAGHRPEKCVRVWAPLRYVPALATHSSSPARPPPPPLLFAVSLRPHPFPALRYCYRQAELGVGDCGGLKYIPGMTKARRGPALTSMDVAPFHPCPSSCSGPAPSLSVSRPPSPSPCARTTQPTPAHAHPPTPTAQNGKQKTPEWLGKMLGVETPAEQPGGGVTLEELLKVE
jgi:hypothetical protein